MKLFAFQPRGHGEYSFFVMAEDEAEARASVETYLQSDGAKQAYIDHSGWGTDYYKVEFFERGQVAVNAND